MEEVQVQELYTNKLRSKEDKILLRSKTQKNSSLRANIDPMTSTSKLEDKIKHKLTKEPQHITTPIQSEG